MCHSQYLGPYLFKVNVALDVKCQIGVHSITLSFIDGFRSDSVQILTMITGCAVRNTNFKVKVTHLVKGQICVRSITLSFIDGFRNDFLQTMI